LNELKKILVIQTAFAGDAILTLPFIQELKKIKLNYLIDVLCIPTTEGIFKYSPPVNEVIVLDKKGKHKSILSLIKFIKELKKKNYSIIYSPHRSLRTSLIVLGLSVKETYGFENSSLKFVYKNSVHYNTSEHEVRRNLNLLGNNYDNDKWRIIPEIKIPSELKAKVSDYLTENNIVKFICIAPGSVWETKRYPVEYLNKIIEYLLSEKYKVVLIGGKEDAELCSDIQKQHTNNVHITAGIFSFVETIELLKSCSLLICNDSAPAHLGMCADIPVLTIYCSTIPGFGFSPYNNKSDYISFDELRCKPCGIHGFNSCPVGTFDCAKLLDPQRVIEKAVKLLNEKI
jgi:heptosyltransferase-2